MRRFQCFVVTDFFNAALKFFHSCNMMEEVEPSEPYAWLRPTVPSAGGPASLNNPAEQHVELTSRTKSSVCVHGDHAIDDELEAMLKRRQELRLVDLESDEAAQLEWAALMLQLDRRMRESYQTNADVPVRSSPTRNVTKSSAVDVPYSSISQIRGRISPAEYAAASASPPLLLDIGDDGRQISGKVQKSRLRSGTDQVRSAASPPTNSRSQQAKPKSFSITFDDEGTVVDVDETSPPSKVSARRNNRSTGMGPVTPSSKFRWFQRESREYISPKKLTATNPGVAGNTGDVASNSNVVLAPETEFCATEGNCTTETQTARHYTDETDAIGTTAPEALYVDGCPDVELQEPSLRDGISRMR